MTERPILFSAPMVRAILEGRKTQTRRVIKPQPPDWAKYPQPVDAEGWEWVEHDRDDDSMGHWPDYYKPMRCPYGKPGDHLWVRETWMPDAPSDGSWPSTQFYGSRMSPLSDIPDRYRHPEHCLYRATQLHSVGLSGWKPSIHMPRWASRITQEVIEVRVQRLQDIYSLDALAEGIQRYGRYYRINAQSYPHTFQRLCVSAEY